VQNVAIQGIIRDCTAQFRLDIWVSVHFCHKTAPQMGKMCSNNNNNNNMHGGRQKSGTE
jgi:hypothetical protein